MSCIRLLQPRPVLNETQSICLIELERISRLRSNIEADDLETSPPVPHSGTPSTGIEVQKQWSFGKLTRQPGRYAVHATRRYRMNLDPSKHPALSASQTSYFESHFGYKPISGPDPRTRYSCGQYCPKTPVDLHRFLGAGWSFGVPGAGLYPPPRKPERLELRTGPSRPLRSHRCSLYERVTRTHNPPNLDHHTFDLQLYMSTILGVYKGSSGY